MEQRITILPGEASPPGFPIGHGPGEYLVDYELHTIRPVPVEVEEPQPETGTATEPLPEPLPEATPLEQGQGG